MQRYIFIITVLLAASYAQSQELYIMTEPASNMPSRSIGVRLTNKFMPMKDHHTYSYRLEPEIMFGVNKNLMFHTNFYASDMFTRKFSLEGGSLYAKYRFLSRDDVHAHFRMAAFGKLSVINNPLLIEHTTLHDQGGGVIHEEKQSYYSNEIDLDGNNSGFSTGIIVTQLMHKLALSATGSYIERWKNVNHDMLPGISTKAANYTLSAGYLLFPRTYKNYKETNLNLYLEWIGSSGLDKKGYYLDAAPGIQFIFNSISRLDIAYRTQVAGDILRYNKSSFLLRYEYNFLNAFKQKEHDN